MRYIHLLSLFLWVYSHSINAAQSPWSEWTETRTFQKEEKNSGDSDLWADTGWEDTDSDKNSSTWDTSYFTEVGMGQFTQDNLSDHPYSLLENRWQVSAHRYVGNAYLSGQFELLIDPLEDSAQPPLRAIDARLITRELIAEWPLSDNTTIKMGQQVLTWGTGDLVFLNDFFPKDWQAMLIGREDRYLKAPSLAIKTSYASDYGDLDVVWHPVFSGDKVVNGGRLSYYDSRSGQISNEKLAVQTSDNRDGIGEWSLRFANTIKGVEYALYAYRGYYKQPLGLDSQTGKYDHPRLNSLGASLRRPFAGGLLNIEVAHWDSVEHRVSSLSSQLPNSQWHSLIGFEKSLLANTTIAAQWLSETNASTGASSSHVQHTFTARLTHEAFQQALTSSLFLFYVPDPTGSGQDDIYWRPKVSYRQNDHWQWEVGANLLMGDQHSRRWGQFETNSNAYLRVRFHFK